MRFQIRSIAQYDPRLIFMILDTCRNSSSDEPARDGGKRECVFNIPMTQTSKALGDHVVAYACGPTDKASDSGERSIDNRRTMLAVV